MCLAVPGKIISIEGDEATIDYGIEQRKAKLLNDELSVGDYAIVQGGFCVMKIEAQEAERALKAYHDICA